MSERAVTRNENVTFLTPTVLRDVLMWNTDNRKPQKPNSMTNVGMQMWEGIFILVGNLPHTQFKGVVKREIEGRDGEKKKKGNIQS